MKKIIQILHYFAIPKILVSGNEGDFLSIIALNYIESLDIDVYLALPPKECGERADRACILNHIPIFRCLRKEYPGLSTEEVVNVDRCNNSSHSVMNFRREDIFFGRTQRNSSNFEHGRQIYRCGCTSLWN